VVSTEVHNVASCIPEDLRAAYINDSDRVGALIGMEDARTLSGKPAAAHVSIRAGYCLLPVLRPLLGHHGRAGSASVWLGWGCFI
jgi:hypothetical protein